MARHTVRDVMTTAVVSAYRGASFKDITPIMIKYGISAVPVIDEGRRVADVVSESDLLAKEQPGQREAQLAGKPPQATVPGEGPRVDPPKN